MDESSVPLFVPTRLAGSAEVVALQVGRRPDGCRVGIAFSRLDLLRAATGPRQDWVRLHEDVLRETLAELGVSVIQFDPVLVGPDVGPGEPAGGTYSRRSQVRRPSSMVA